MGSSSKKLHFTLLLGVVFMATLFSVEGAVIDPFNHGDQAIVQLGVISPLPRSCAFSETATLVKMEVTSCTSQPCLMNVSNTYEMSPTFIPGYSSNTTQYQLRFYYESKLYIFALISLTDSFIAGSQYKILRQIVIPSELGGKSGYFRVVLFDLSGRYHVSRCFDAMVGN